LGRSSDAGRGAGQKRQKNLRRLASLVLLGLAASAGLPGMMGEASAQRLLQVSDAKHALNVTVAVGKTEDVCIDQGSTDTHQFGRLSAGRASGSHQAQDRQPDAAFDPGGAGQVAAAASPPRE
jgi:hypothetical protein